MEKMWFSWAVKMGKMGKMGEVSFCFLSFPLGLDFSRILVVVVVILFGICWLIHRYCYLLAAKRPLRSLWFLQNFQVCQCMHT